MLSSAAPANPVPHGPGGAWQLAFDDEFSGDALDPARWKALDGWRMNNVITAPDDVAVRNGHLVLTVSSPTSRGAVDSSPTAGAGHQGFRAAGRRCRGGPRPLPRQRLDDPELADLVD